MFVVVSPCVCFIDVMVINLTGQISVQRSILIVKQYRSKYKEGVEAYIEEAIIRRELADNFCFYNKNYDSIEGIY